MRRWCLPALTGLIVLFTVTSGHARTPGDRATTFSRLHAANDPVASFEDMMRASLSAAEGRVLADYETLHRIATGLDEFEHEVAALETLLQQSPVLRPDVDDRIRASWGTFLRQRKALLAMVVRYLDLTIEEKSLLFGPSLHQKQVLVGYGAALFLFSSVVRMTARLEGPGRLLWKKFDEADPAYGLSAGSFSHLWRVVTNRTNIRALAEARTAYFEAYPAARDGEAAGEWLHARIAREHRFMDEHAPVVWREKLRQLWQLIVGSVAKPSYKMWSALAIWAGDTKYLRRPPTITLARVREMTALLEPGDILIERENYWLSNAFLPGFWPHGIVYVGTVEDLEELELTDDPRVAPHLAAYATPDGHGHTRRVLEAISEGVLASSMEEACDADYIAAFRPRISRADKREAIARAFAHLGKPYDFHFDFFSADALVCTELVYRAYAPILTLPLEKVSGRLALTAGNLIEKFERERESDDRSLDFVFFVDSDRKAGTTWFSDADALVQSNQRPGLAVFLPDEKATTR